MNKKRVLLTGIGGSIGCHTLIHILKNTDWDVVGLDSFKHMGLTDRVYMVMREHEDLWPRLTVFQHDLKASIADILSKEIGHIDYIINMASRSDVDNSIVDPENFIMDNVQSTITMLEYARKAKPQAFIQISTDEVYGPSGEFGAHKEWSALIPSNPYSASKACQEVIAISYWRCFGVPVIITNTMNNFGEMQQPQKFPSMVQKKVAKGETVIVHGTKTKIGSRFYLHSRNFADALVFLLNKKAPYMHKEGEVDRPDRYNIVGDKRIYNLELAQLIAKLMKKPLKYKLVDFHKTRPGHDRHYGLDGTKLADLGWKSPISFEESMKQTIAWQKRHQQWL